MHTNFAILFQFLDAFPAPVRPHSGDELPVELKDLIRRFAAGILSDDEMLALYRELRGNEYAMEMLASTLNGE